MTTFRSKLAVCTTPVNPTFTTADLFDKTHVEPLQSPIDQYTQRLYAINTLAPIPTAYNHLQAQLVLLGVVAAVESYFRTLLRRLIAIDPICSTKNESQFVAYGAAMYLPKGMLPEAILEKVSFISEKNIRDAIREFAAIEGNLPSDLVTTIKDYERLCHLRHCAVHRFGKLGAKNAIFFGLKDHKPSLEKPLMLNYAALQNAIAISTGVVKTTNNFLFNEVISRLPPATWKGTFRSDKREFLTYFDLFADTVSSTKASPAEDVYKIFMSQRANFKAGIAF